MKAVTSLIIPLTMVVCSASALAGTRFAVVSHAPDNDPFWNVVKNGIADAQKDFGVTVDYRSPRYLFPNRNQRISIGQVMTAFYAISSASIRSRPPSRLKLCDRCRGSHAATELNIAALSEKTDIVAVGELLGPVICCDDADIMFVLPNHGLVAMRQPGNGTSLRALRPRPQTFCRRGSNHHIYL
ncbi:hypothetical protein ACFSHT_16310 [Paraburkholderia silviterrae]|uniref:Uncharacterized protein n=1 Tax=Paraburkholderia silviterrae TaxID=2528715 RepID=A0A4R5M9W7_9BURK|nr:hypothetical protein [Paraburkholderia silviterrae]TDG23151.1 hypothetical protein EYW47_14510 [Paraburkholderia silviterrae]